MRYGSYKAPIGRFLIAKNTMSKSKYEKMAEAILEANFWVAGCGHFDVTRQEVAEILRLADAFDQQGLKELYDRLAAQRLG